MTDPYPTGPVVYILRNGKSLYVGATIDLSHRIRQHNGELSGGAHRTSTKGPGWVCLLYVQGFQSRTESLQFEYALKREAKQHGYSRLGVAHKGQIFLRDGFAEHTGVLRWVGGVCRARFGGSSATPRLTPRLLTGKK